MRQVGEEDTKELFRIFRDRFKDLDCIPTVGVPGRFVDAYSAFALGWLVRDECESPELDRTPFQSHSFSRGEEYGIEEAIRGVEDILSGKDDGSAPSFLRFPPFEGVRGRLIALKQKAEGPSLRRDGGG